MSSLLNENSLPSAAKRRKEFTDFGFAGGIYDADTKLVRFGARDYDPEIGRWLDKEPLGFAGSNNFYAYCSNDPVNLIDKDGLRPIINDFRDFFGASTDALTTIPFTNYSALDLFGDLGNYDPCSDAAKAGSLYGTAIGLASAAKGLWNAGKGLFQSANKIKYIGRLEDLKNIPRNQTFLDQLPNLGSPKANYYQNMSVLRKALREGKIIKDASWFRPNSELAPTLLNPSRTIGQTFLGAERNLLQNRGLWP
ncbi:MAG: RHS repeat-associated core domain-containing protein [Ignavibacteria bacterium]|nr:RHS repeat-associated core domain-containing protein [Ignavibacteria bacterium]